MSDLPPPPPGSQQPEPESRGTDDESPYRGLDSDGSGTTGPPPPPSPGAYPPPLAAPPTPPSQAWPPQPQPLPPQPMAPGAPQPAFPPAATPSSPVNSGKAVASMVTGIVSLFLCYWFLMLPAGVTAVILGVLALKETDGIYRSGRGMAIAGLVTGGFATLGALVSVVWTVFSYGTMLYSV